ncbi:hypothetical protein EST92_07610 [Streptomyces sp. TM32]|uniref:hypothetical protein n=1 Tax=Streptomyces sp. TM32 TaxID=1652669 RepID=UPI0010112584|nr:hypothetical protein [Streptomyces sp. TM32]RXS85658.1 hypothetical protein EST92_07610 [Streptomyces sp. TM32]
MIESLNSFTVSVEYARAHTTFLVRADGQREPAARVHREVHYEGLRPYTVTAGPGLTECVGHLNEWKAWLPDRTLVGTVEHSRRTNSADRWTFAQHDLGELTGAPVGAGSRLRHASPLRMAFDAVQVNNVLSHRLRFRSHESEGFELSRPAGVRSGYEVTVHDPRVSRLLVLACLVQFNRYVASDPRKNLVDLVSNPLKE